MTSPPAITPPSSTPASTFTSPEITPPNKLPPRIIKNTPPPTAQTPQAKRFATEQSPPPYPLSPSYSETSLEIVRLNKNTIPMLAKATFVKFALVKQAGYKLLTELHYRPEAAEVLIPPLEPLNPSIFDNFETYYETKLKDFLDLVKRVGRSIVFFHKMSEERAAAQDKPTPQKIHTIYKEMIRTRLEITRIHLEYVILRRKLQISYLNSG